MNNNIDHSIVKKIILFSYEEFNTKQRTNITKSQIIDDIVQKIKRELRDYANSEN